MGHMALGCSRAFYKKTTEQALPYPQFGTQVRDYCGALEGLRGIDAALHED